MFKVGKWAEQILLQLRSDGGWGYFHSLARPQMGELTTEQALRRLSRLGFTMEDEPIARAVQYLEDCLLHRICTPDRVEKTHDWEIGTQMMFAAWIRHFKKENKHANHVAHCWAQVIHEAFISGEYSETHYLRGFLQVFGKPPKGPRLLDNARGKWDLGAEANDGVYFPLSDHWRTNENREHDCTYRIEKLLSKLKL